MPGGYDGSTLQKGVSMSGPGKGKVGFFFECAPELAAAFRAYARGRGEKVAEAAARALRREMANPPPLPTPPPDPPLPPLPPVEVKPKKPKGK